MRKLVLKMSISLDGFVSSLSGENDWMARSRNLGVNRWIERTLWRAGLHVMGTRTYWAMRSYWPSSSERMAIPMNAIPKAVFTRQESFQPEADHDRKAVAAHSPSSANWTEAEVVDGDLATEILRLKHQAGKPILALGGADFAQSLVATGLIDEYRFLIHPVVLGKGRPLFDKIHGKLALELRATTSFRSGVVANVYSPR